MVTLWPPDYFANRFTGLLFTDFTERSYGPFATMARMSED